MSSRVKMLFTIVITVAVSGIFFLMYKFYPRLVSNVMSFTVTSKKSNAVLASGGLGIISFLLWWATGLRSENNFVHIFFSACIGICFILMLLVIGFL